MNTKTPLLIQGASSVDDVPGLATISDQAEFFFAPDRAALEVGIKDAEVVFGWNFRADDLKECWNLATNLKWIHWGGAGVDAAMFPALINSDVVLTNSRGVFDRAMAEWTLGVMIAHAKNFVETLDSQRKSQWDYRLNRLMHDQNALVVGVGSIGREIARMLKQFGLNVTGIGRTARDNDPDFGHVHGQGELNGLLDQADYVILIAPLTPENENMFSAPQFSAMKPDAQFVSIGRGALVNETDMVNALNNGDIGSAALDVFREEPLSPENPIWSAKNTIISPHVCGDYLEHKEVLARMFLTNFERYRVGKDLTNMVDKSRGYVRNEAL